MDLIFDSESELSFNITKNQNDSNNIMNLNALKAKNFNVPVLIKPRNYPFYYKIKKNLYIM